MNDLIQRIQDALRKVRKRGDVPTMIWLGQEEKCELEKLGRQKEKEICNLPYSFVSSPKWLTISYEEK